jgi:hypothetical protein
MAAFLKQEDLARKYERHSELPQAVEPERVHEEWEADMLDMQRVYEYLSDTRNTLDANPPCTSRGAR